MAILKPTLLPEWASDNVQDDLSGQYNVVEPPIEIKKNGWPIQVKPNRQWWNWFNRTVYDWINYFNDNLDFDADNFTPTWTGFASETFDTNYGYYSKEGDRVYFVIQIVWTANSGTAGLSVTNLPYTSKNQPAFQQSCHISRGGSALPGQGILSGLIPTNSNTLNIWKEDPTSGAGSQADNAGTSGQLIISGFYFIEPLP